MSHFNHVKFPAALFRLNCWIFSEWHDVSDAYWLSGIKRLLAWSGGRCFTSAKQKPNLFSSKIRLPALIRPPSAWVLSGPSAVPSAASPSQLTRLSPSDLRCCLHSGLRGLKGLRRRNHGILQESKQGVKKSIIPSVRRDFYFGSEVVITV